MFRRYKEIIYGFGLGLAMWIVDAAMHARLGSQIHSPGFVSELLRPGPTQIFFRGFYVAVAAALGVALWRSNWRERELRALEDAVIAFHRQLDSPAMRIVSHIRMLQGRPGVTHDEVAMSIAEAIGDDARIIDELAKQYLRLSEQVMAGRTREAIETLRAIEAWTTSASASATPHTPPSSAS
jgi:hypothetical protein